MFCVSWLVEIILVFCMVEKIRVVEMKVSFFGVLVVRGNGSFLVFIVMGFIIIKCF